MDIEIELQRLYEGRGYFRGLASRYVETDTEDIVQEAFTKAWELREGFRGECEVKTWLVRILINLCLGQRRKMYSRKVRMVVLSLDATKHDIPISPTIEGEIWELEALTLIGGIAKRLGVGIETSGELTHAQKCKRCRMVKEIKRRVQCLEKVKRHALTVGQS
jgi:RNA polymerase sigma factor (sigma-70 family)